MQPIAIHHQDDDLLVVDKPPGVLVVPAPGRRGPTLIDLLERQLGRRLMPVHRLDEETSGALLVAQTDAARIGLEAQFRSHSVERVYLALVAGTPSPANGRIQARLAVDGDLVRVVRSGGEVAVTDYQLLARRGRCSLLRCRLETGRRNQIRVHMAELGCPLAGDRKYGYRIRGGERFARVMLHSWRLGFQHPTTSIRLDIVVEPREPELQP
ncbi:MAG TPA: RluA family pseudouridine synthase [Planctomycetota bacterium]|nr:RluA family pseudouridine synthase [Planctomycetota bacterium]